ncbi:MAG: TolC family protein, partial [Gammaproteobacteria bacterium]|nr:TolC family protein [Gammaproteobacteria bacterium]
MNRMGSIRRQTRCGLVILGLLALARLDAANIEGALSMEEAINRTLARNPDLMALGHQIEAQQGRVAQSGIGPAPELALDVENVLGTAGFRGIGAGEETLSLSWVLERGKRQNHVAAARAGLSIVEAEMEIRRLDAATLS